MCKQHHIFFLFFKSCKICKQVLSFHIESPPPCLFLPFLVRESHHNQELHDDARSIVVIVFMFMNCVPPSYLPG
jgi:hypothetical protein